MPSTPFKAALPFILRWEGGFVNHPNDPGGATNKGVTQKVYNDWRQRRGLGARDVRQLDEGELLAIYEEGYWLPPGCNVLATPLDLIEFDTAVNMGPSRAVRFLQSCVGCGVDGNFGPSTRTAVENFPDFGAAVIGYCKRREDFYNSLIAKNSKLGVFKKGWMNRLNALRKEAGLPGYEAAVPLDFGDTGYIARIPDIGEDSGAIQ